MPVFGPGHPMLEPPPLPKSRLEGLTDGIFAVSMTLLVLDLKFPPPQLVDAKGMWRTLLDLVPLLDAYIISFTVLCVFWLAHLRLLKRMRDVDLWFTTLNLALLLLTTFVPPLTRLLDEHATHPRAAITYGTNLVAILVLETLMWRHAMRNLANETVTEPSPCGAWLATASPLGSASYWPACLWPLPNSPSAWKAAWRRTSISC